MDYLIIGNGVACGRRNRGHQVDRPRRPHYIISSEPHRVYGRPLISSLLSGKIREKDIFYRPEDFYESNNVTALLGKTVSEIRAGVRQVILESGEVLPFGKLLIATGGVPFIPPIEGQARARTFTCSQPSMTRAGLTAWRKKSQMSSCWAAGSSG